MIAIYQLFQRKILPLRQNRSEQRRQVPPTLGPFYETRGITLYSAFVGFWLVDNLAKLAEVSTVYVFCFVSPLVPLTSLWVKSAAINRLASSEQSEFCRMGYCTDILEIDSSTERGQMG